MGCVARDRWILMVATVMLAGCSTPETRPGHTVPVTRVERLRKGVSVSTWFRGFESGFTPGSLGVLSQAEMRQMRRMGISHVRLALDPALFYRPDAPRRLDPTYLKALDDAILGLFEEDIAVVLDLHDEKKPYDAVGVGAEQGRRWLDGLVPFWSEMSDHYRRFDPDRLFFELLNEPTFKRRSGEWAAVQEQCVQAIRKHCPRHTIIATVTDWSSVDRLVDLRPSSDPNVVYAFHFYEPYAFTHQGAPWADKSTRALRGLPYPVQGSLPEGLSSSKSAVDYFAERWNRERVRKRIDLAGEWSRKWGRPVWCGEFGAYPKSVSAASRTAWFTDVADALRANRIGACIWSWDEGLGLKYMTDSAGRPVPNPEVAKAVGLLPDRREDPKKESPVVAVPVPSSTLAPGNARRTVRKRSPHRRRALHVPRRRR